MLSFGKVITIIIFLTLGHCSFAAPVVFSAIADTPYNSMNANALSESIIANNYATSSKFFVHLGDIKKGSTSCVESVYQNMKGSLLLSNKPSFIIPGDNEWSDCSNYSQAWGHWMTHLYQIETVGNWGTQVPAVTRQQTQLENFYFTVDHVLFIGVNLVDLDNSSDTPASVTDPVVLNSANWVANTLAAFKNNSLIKSAVILIHALPLKPRHSTFKTAFELASVDFVKPILYLHGDEHQWKWNQGHLDNLTWNVGSNVFVAQLGGGGGDFVPPVEIVVPENGDFSYDSYDYVYNPNPELQPLLYPILF